MAHKDVVSVIDSVPITKERPPPPGAHSIEAHCLVFAAGMHLHPHATLYQSDSSVEFAVDVLEDKLGDAGQPRANRAVTIDKPDGNPDRCAQAVAISMQHV